MDHKHTGCLPYPEEHHPLHMSPTCRDSDAERLANAAHRDFISSLSDCALGSHHYSHGYHACQDSRKVHALHRTRPFPEGVHMYAMKTQGHKVFLQAQDSCWMRAAAVRHSWASEGATTLIWSSAVSLRGSAMRALTELYLMSTMSFSLADVSI